MMMDLKTICRTGLALLAVQAAQLSAAEPTNDSTRNFGVPGSPLRSDQAREPEDVLYDDESEFVDYETSARGRAALIQFDTTAEEPLVAQEVSHGDNCFDEELQYVNPYDSIPERSCFEEWFSSMDCREPFWYSGVEMTYVNIDARTGGQITLSQSDTTAPGIASVSILDGNGLNDRGFAPRLWVGHRFGEKWAVQARYWNLNRNISHFPNQSAPPTGTNFATFTEVDRMDASALDVEAVRSFHPGDWKIDAFVGGRHATLGVDSQIHDFGVFTTGNFTNLVLANGFGFDGTGVTYGLSVRRKIGDTNAFVFASARGSTLAGYSDSYGRAAGTVASSPSAPLVGAATVRRNNAKSDLYIAEIQMGVEWNYELKNYPANFFFRTGYEYQDWNIVGPRTGGAGFGGTIGELTTNSFSSAGLGDMQLHGVSFATGLTW